MAKGISNYAEFWDFYLEEHSVPMTRNLHFAGTALGVVVLITIIAVGRWYWFPLSLIIGYGFAWFAHFIVEKNKPASFKYPLWSFISDYKMMWYMLTGRLGGELERIDKTRTHPQIKV